MRLRRSFRGWWRRRWAASLRDCEGGKAISEGCGAGGSGGEAGKAVGFLAGQIIVPDVDVWREMDQEMRICFTATPNEAAAGYASAVWTAGMASAIPSRSISAKALALINDEENLLHFSPVSVWEVAIKNAQEGQSFWSIRICSGGAYWIMGISSLQSPASIRWSG